MNAKVLVRIAWGSLVAYSAKALQAREPAKA